MKLKSLLFFLIISVLILCCKPGNIIRIHGTQSFISLKLVDSTHYKYLYYNLSLDSLKYEYNIGKYRRIGNFFKLFPDSIDNENFEAQCQERKIDSVKKLILHITTDIVGNYLDQYKIQIIADKDQKIVFNNVKADTFFTKASIKSISIKVNLAEKFSKGIGTQLPTFTSINTRKIIIDSFATELRIHIPISFSTFFYKYQKDIDLEAMGINWMINGVNVTMRNVDF